MSVRISAVVCTHNRAGYLRKALQSLVDQTLEPSVYEIIVVDNGSQDNTKQVVSEFCNVPNLRYLYEPIIGVSRARNTGWRNAEGEYIAFLDDDAVACPEWLARFIDVFETFEPSPGAVGGRIDPMWEAARPDWLSDKLLGYLSALDWSDVPIIATESQWLSACNMAVPKEVLGAVEGFPENLGRQGSRLLANGENYLLQQVDSRGFYCLYHPEIVVGHHVSPSKLTKKWFRERAYWQGVSDAFMSTPHHGIHLPLRACLAVRRIGWAIPRLFIMLIATKSATRFRRQCQALEALGYVSGLRRLSVEARHPFRE